MRPTDRSVESFAYALVELLAVEHERVVARPEDATLGGDAASSVDVVSGHHSHRYAGPLTLADSVRHLYSTIQYTCITSAHAPMNRRRRSCASPVLTATGLVNGNPSFFTPHRIDVP